MDRYRRIHAVLPNNGAAMKYAPNFRNWKIKPTLRTNSQGESILTLPKIPAKTEKQRVTMYAKQRIIDEFVYANELGSRYSTTAWRLRQGDETYFRLLL
jgi:hypothetical protein